MWHPIQVDSTGKRVIISGTGPPITEKRSIDEGRICLRLLRRQRDFTRRLGRLGYQNPAMGARRRVRLCALPRLRKGNIDRGARGETGQPLGSSQIQQKRSEKRRVGKEGVSTCRARGSPYH